MKLIDKIYFDTNSRPLLYRELMPVGAVNSKALFMGMHCSCPL